MRSSREPLSFNERPTGVSASEPVSLFVVKSLLYPVVPVLTLGCALLLWREPLHGHYFLIAVLAFMGAAEVLDAVPIDAPRAPSLAFASLIDIVARWLLVIAFIWALLEIAGLAQRFNWQVLLTWAISTPAVLWFSQLSAPRVLHRIGLRRSSRKKVVIAGATELGAKLAERIAAAPWLDTEVVGFFDDRSASRLPPRCAKRLLGKLSDVSGFVARNAIDTVYITLPMTRQRRVPGATAFARRFDELDLLRSGSHGVRSRAAALRSRERRARRRGVRVAVLRRARHRQARERHRDRLDPHRAYGTCDARGRGRDQAHLARPGNLPTEALRLGRQRDHRLQVPFDDGDRGRSSHLQASDAQ